MWVLPFVKEPLKPNSGQYQQWYEDKGHSLFPS